MHVSSSWIFAFSSSYPVGHFSSPQFSKTPSYGLSGPSSPGTGKGEVRVRGAEREGHSLAMFFLNVPDSLKKQSDISAIIPEINSCRLVCL